MIFWKSHKLASSNLFSDKDQERQFEVLYEKPVKQIAFTKGFLWGVLDTGKVLQWAIEKLPTQDGENESFKINKKPREV